MMRRVGGGDDDQVDGPGEQLIHAADEVDIRITGVRGAVALDDGAEAQTRDRANDGCVEYFAGEAEADEADVERVCPRMLRDWRRSGCAHERAPRRFEDSTSLSKGREDDPPCVN